MERSVPSTPEDLPTNPQNDGLLPTAIGRCDTPTTAPLSTQTTLEIKVMDQEGFDIVIRLKPTTPFRKVFEAFAKRKGVAIDVYRFLYEGHRINLDDTPEKLEMEDKDIIDVVLQQTGGRY